MEQLEKIAEKYNLRYEKWSDLVGYETGEKLLAQDASSNLVVYEELTLNGEKLAEHKDLNDEGQTIYFPGVGTTALDKDTNDHISKADKEITIVDTVRYTNLAAILMVPSSIGTTVLASIRLSHI